MKILSIDYIKESLFNAYKYFLGTLFVTSILMFFLLKNLLNIFNMNHFSNLSNFLNLLSVSNISNASSISVMKYDLLILIWILYINLFSILFDFLIYKKKIDKKYYFLPYIIVILILLSIINFEKINIFNNFYSFNFLYDYTVIALNNIYILKIIGISCINFLTFICLFINIKKENKELQLSKIIYSFVNIIYNFLMLSIFLYISFITIFLLFNLNIFYLFIFIEVVLVYLFILIFLGSLFNQENNIDENNNKENEDLEFLTYTQNSNIDRTNLEYQSSDKISLKKRVFITKMIFFIGFIFVFFSLLLAYLYLIYNFCIYKIPNIVYYLNSVLIFVMIYTFCYRVQKIYMNKLEKIIKIIIFVSMPILLAAFYEICVLIYKFDLSMSNNFLIVILIFNLFVFIYTLLDKNYDIVHVLVLAIILIFITCNSPINANNFSRYRQKIKISKILNDINSEDESILKNKEILEKLDNSKIIFNSLTKNTRNIQEKKELEDIVKSKEKLFDIMYSKEGVFELYLSSQQNILNVKDSSVAVNLNFLKDEVFVSDFFSNDEDEYLKKDKKRYPYLININKEKYEISLLGLPYSNNKNSHIKITKNDELIFEEELSLICKEIFELNKYQNVLDNEIKPLIIEKNGREYVFNIISFNAKKLKDKRNLSEELIILNAEFLLLF